MFEKLEAQFAHVLDELRRRHSVAAAPGSTGTGGTPAAPHRVPTDPPPNGRIIREVLDPEFLATHLAAIRATGAARPGGSRLPEEAYAQAEAELKEAQQQAPNVPLMPRRASAANLQSILTTCIESRFGQLLKDVPHGVERIAHALIGDDELFREFGPCDPLWMETKLAEEWAKIDLKPPFPDTPAGPVALADDARVILVGDWGTGLPGAAAVATQIAARIEQARGREQHVIHLGDVYYSGWREEYETRFLRYWPVAREEREVLCWSLNGNHDMYSGGHGYFGYLLQDPRFRGHWREGHPDETPSSWFSIENEHWQILGLDSAYHDHNLEDPQQQWLAGKLSPTRRTLLLTHHQPFSAYEQVTQAMTEKVAAALDGRPLDAWFWGHEHRCTIYPPGEPGEQRPLPGLAFGSCVGNGGVPQILPDPPLPEGTKGVEGYAPLRWAYNGDEPADGNKWLRFGFAVLDFDGPRVDVEYVDEHGAQVERVPLP